MMLFVSSNAASDRRKWAFRTLDPAATGLMVVLVGAATRTLDYLDEFRKSYSLVVRLGEETDSGDRDGNVIRVEDPYGFGFTAD